jgi:tetratricopeptide (TPR) repeat protein
MYPHPGSSLSGWHVLGAFFVLLAITAAVAANWRRRYLVVGWLWFLGTMVPMVGLVQVGRQALADRYAYVPFVGIFIMVCWSVAEWAGRRHFPTSALVGATVLLLLALFALTHGQLGYWQDNASIWKHTLEVTGPNNFEAEAQVGTSLRKDGHQREALQHFYHVLSAKPDDALSNLGVALYEHQNGHLADSIGHYKKWLAQAEDDDDDRRQVLINMGFVYKKLGDAEHSQQCFEAAAKVPSQ